MQFNFLDLDDDVRKLMLEEVNLDISNNNLYYSKRFNKNGIDKYSHLLVESIKSGNEQTLADSMKQEDMFNATEVRKNGVSAKVPFDANKILADGEFNRFYIRALALIAINQNKSLEVYRAKDVVGARSASIAKIGEIVDPNTVLEDLRKNIGIDTFLGLPNGVNSGLSVKFI